MEISTRKRDFIKAITELYDKTRNPIHYTNIATLLGVGKWSAYDMLVQLEKMGFLERKYQNSPNQSGRSKAFFVPSKEAYEILSATEKKGGEMTEAEWEEKKELLLTNLNRFVNQNVGDAMASMSEEFRNSEDHFDISLNFFCLLHYHLELSEKKVPTKVKSILSDIDNSLNRLIAYLGAILAIIVSNERIGKEELSLLINQIISVITNLSPEEHSRLSEFLFLIT